MSEKQKEPCPTCGGTGQIGEEQFYQGRSVGWKECPKCEGEGIEPCEKVVGFFCNTDMPLCQEPAEQSEGIILINKCLGLLYDNMHPMTKAEISTLLSKIKLCLEDAEKEIKRLKEANKKLHRRTQEAESALIEWRKISKLTEKQSTGRFYPTLLRYALTKTKEENKRLKAMYEAAKGDLDDVIIGRDETIKQLQDEIERLRKENNVKESRKNLSA